jgi:hypothetical protein
MILGDGILKIPDKYGGNAELAGQSSETIHRTFR